VEKCAGGCRRRFRTKPRKNTLPGGGVVVSQFSPKGAITVRAVFRNIFEVFCLAQFSQLSFQANLVNELFSLD
jgi:hypothetical protein